MAYLSCHVTYRAINNFISCSVGEMREQCGVEAAEFHLTLTSKLIDGALDLIDCQLSVTGIHTQIVQRTLLAPRYITLHSVTHHIV